jgi:hypothetical protein
MRELRTSGNSRVATREINILCSLMIIGLAAALRKEARNIKPKAKG